MRNAIQIDTQATELLQTAISELEEQLDLVKRTTSNYDHNTVNYLIQEATNGHPHIKFIPYSAGNEHSDKVNAGLAEFMSSDCTDLIMPIRPVRIEQGSEVQRQHFTGLHIRKILDGLPQITYIDPTGFGTIQDIPNKIRNQIHTILRTSDQSIFCSRTQIQHTTIHAEGGVIPRTASNQHCGAFVADLLPKIATGKIGIRQYQKNSALLLDSKSNVIDPIDQNKSNHIGVGLRDSHHQKLLIPKLIAEIQLENLLKLETATIEAYALDFNINESGTRDLGIIMQNLTLIKSFISTGMDDGQINRSFADNRAEFSTMHPVIKNLALTPDGNIKEDFWRIAPFLLNDTPGSEYNRDSAGSGLTRNLIAIFESGNLTNPKAKEVVIELKAVLDYVVGMGAGDADAKNFYTNFITNVIPAAQTPVEKIRNTHAIDNNTRITLRGSTVSQSFIKVDGSLYSVGEDKDGSITKIFNGDFTEELTVESKRTFGTLQNAMWGGISDRQELNGLISKLRSSAPLSNSEKSKLLMIHGAFFSIPSAATQAIVTNNRNIIFTSECWAQLLEFVCTGNVDNIRDRHLKLALQTCNVAKLQELRSFYGQANSIAHYFFQESQHALYKEPRSVEISTSHLPLAEDLQTELQNQEKYGLFSAGGGHDVGLVFDDKRDGAGNGKLVIYAQDSTEITTEDTLRKYLSRILRVYPDITAEELSIVKTCKAKAEDVALSAEGDSKFFHGISSQCRYTAIIFSEQVLQRVKDGENISAGEIEYTQEIFEQKFAEWFDKGPGQTWVQEYDDMYNFSPPPPSQTNIVNPLTNRQNEEEQQKQKDGFIPPIALEDEEELGDDGDDDESLQSEESYQESDSDDDSDDLPEEPTQELIARVANFLNDPRLYNKHNREALYVIDPDIIHVVYNSNSAPLLYLDNETHTDSYKSIKSRLEELGISQNIIHFDDANNRIVCYASLEHIGPKLRTILFGAKEPSSFATAAHLKREIPHTDFEEAHDFSQRTATTQRAKVDNFDDLLTQRSFCIGKTDGNSSLKFLIENMQSLKDQGYTTLFVESLFYDSAMQDYLDEYFENAEDTIPRDLTDYLHSLNRKNNIEPGAYNYSHLIEAAKRSGIRIVGLDAQITYDSGATAEDKAAQRDFLSSKIIGEKLYERPQTKWIALMSDSRTQEHNGIRGFPEIMGTPLVRISQVYEPTTVAFKAGNASAVEIKARTDESLSFGNLQRIVSASLYSDMESETEEENEERDELDSNGFPKVFTLSPTSKGIAKLLLNKARKRIQFRTSRQTATNLENTVSEDEDEIVSSSYDPLTLGVRQPFLPSNFNSTHKGFYIDSDDEIDSSNTSSSSSETQKLQLTAKATMSHTFTYGFNNRIPRDLLTPNNAGSRTPAFGTLTSRTQPLPTSTSRSRRLPYQNSSANESKQTTGQPIIVEQFRIPTLEVEPQISDFTFTTIPTANFFRNDSFDRTLGENLVLIKSSDTAIKNPQFQVTTTEGFLAGKIKFKDVIDTAISNARAGTDLTDKEVGAIILIAIKNGGIGNSELSLNREINNLRGKGITTKSPADLKAAAIAFSENFQEITASQKLYTGDDKATHLEGMRLKSLTPESAKEFLGEEKYTLLCRSLTIDKIVAQTTDKPSSRTTNRGGNSRLGESHSRTNSGSSVDL